MLNGAICVIKVGDITVTGGSGGGDVARRLSG